MPISDGPAPVENRGGDSLHFRVAKPEDEAAIVDILSEAAAWARARGIERWWPVPFPLEWIAPGVARGEVYVILLGPKTIGTLTLSRDDPRMWGNVPPDVAYVHRLAVRRAFAYRGYGADALDWAAAQVRGWGRTKLRLDCLATNTRLVPYYLSQGFREIRRVEGNIPGEVRPSVLFEREIGEPTAGRTLTSDGAVPGKDRRG